MKENLSKEQLIKENQELRIRLQEAEDTLQAIREGAVDALIVQGAAGEQIFTLSGEELVYRKLVETMNEGGLTADSNGRIMYCNERFGKMLQRPMEDIIGKSLEDFVLHTERRGLNSLLIRAIDKPSRARIVFKASDGTLVPSRVSANALQNGDSVSICMVAADMTKIEESEETIRLINEQQNQLRESQARLKFSAEAGGIGTWDWDVENDVLIWGQRTRTMFGVEQDRNITHKLFLSFLHRDDRQMVEKAIAECIQKGEKYDIEYRVIRPDGSIRWIYSKGHGIFDEHGKCLRMTGVTLDITESKQKIELLEHLNNELKRSNDELEQFAYIVSHDLREPLRAISGFMGLLKEKYKNHLDAKANEYINYATQGVIRMDELLACLLDYSRVSTRAQVLTQVSAKESLNAAIANLHRSIAESNAAVTFDELPTVKADGRQLTQLFQNLIQNAIKFKSDEKPQIRIGCRKQDNKWLFWVKDNGIGMDKQHFDRIFNIFHRLDRSGKYSGSGIGLSICKKIVERHGGHIWVESERGKGSTFYFIIRQY